MARGARAVIGGLDWYIGQNRTDGRAVRELDASAVVRLPVGDVDARIDVVLIDGESLGARAVLWDGPNFSPALAPQIACLFGLAPAEIYDDSGFTTVGVWQARRQRAVEVPFATAVAEAANVNPLLASI